MILLFALQYNKKIALMQIKNNELYVCAIVVGAGQYIKGKLKK